MAYTYGKASTSPVLIRIGYPRFLYLHRRPEDETRIYRLLQ